MVKLGLDAYIVPSGDEHQSEYVAEADERRKYVSGFSGSAGTAIVTSTHQALWTDGRYFLQADEELDCNWILMKEMQPDVPTILEWLQQTLPQGSKVGADSKLVSAQNWLTYSETLQASSITMTEVAENLVDLIWESRPDYSQDRVFALGMEYAGKSWQDKVAEVRETMTTEGADMLIITALDEVAWLLNLRGSDIPYNPVFRSYMTITASAVNLFVPLNKMTPEVKEHLASEDTPKSVNIDNYDSFWLHLKNAAPTKAMIPTSYSYAEGVSFAVYSRIREDARMLTVSPVLLLKAKKNTVEIQGMKNAHIKDAVALCDFLNFMEKEITSGNHWTEISAAEELAKYRAKQEGAMGLSFSTISAFGSNGAVIHYEPTLATDSNITTSSLYLLDSGGQYLAPTQVRIYSTEDHAFQPGYFFSNEPGFYKDYEFGIRLESIMTVVQRNTEYNMVSMLAFEAVTLVPFEPKLINTAFLNEKQCYWLNMYHYKVRSVVGKELLNQNRSDTYEWLKSKTEPLECGVPVAGSMKITVSLLLLLFSLFFSLK